MERQKLDILELFDSKPYLKVCAPMVRYSKLQFRTLVRKYGCDLCFTPMIMADSFRQSAKARDNEFTTNALDGPTIVQFAANTAVDFVGAASMVAPYSEGADLNCGCPQRWAKQMGLGCALLDTPEIIADMVRTCRNAIAKPFTVSVKMRILKDLRRTVEIARQLEKAGVSFLSVHARTAAQLTGDINVEALKLIVENVDCPVVANGGVRSLADCDDIHAKTNCKGVMVANAILANPTLFSGSNQTTPDCVQNWLDICYNTTIRDYDKAPSTIEEKPSNLTFQCFHHHLVFMLEKLLPKRKRRTFNNLQNFSDVLDFLDKEMGIKSQLYGYEEYCDNRNAVVKYEKEDESTQDFSYYRYENNGGHFTAAVEDCDSDCDLGDLFI